MSIDRVVYAIDPPWPFAKRKVGTKFGGGAENHYPLMKAGEILRLFKLIGDVTTVDNAAMFLWTTNSHLPLAIKCVEAASGFRYATVGFNWVKLNKDGSYFKGPGAYTAKGSELCLLAIKGSMPPTERLVSEIIAERKTEHSKKPEEARNRIERIFPLSTSTRHIELFSRQANHGWESFGNQTSGNDIFDDVKGLF